MVRGNMGFAQHSNTNALYFIAGFSLRARQALLRGPGSPGSATAVESRQAGLSSADQLRRPLAGKTGI